MQDETPEIASLRDRMAQAIAEDRYEDAAALRDELQRLTGGTGTRLQRQVPGRMGLGTDQTGIVPPTGWKRPKKPDPMTKGHKPGGRR